MVSLTKQSSMDRAKESLRDVVSYADEVIRDERLRADIRAAVGHGTKAGDRVKRDIDAGSITTRLAADKKLRENVRAAIDDLESASERLRRKNSHRVRNVLLVVAGTAAALAVIPRFRRWLSEGTSEPTSGATPA